MHSIIDHYIISQCLFDLIISYHSVCEDVGNMSDHSPSSSCHQTIFFHSSAHCFPTSVNIIRLSKEQGYASGDHCNMCAVVSSAFPQEHVVSPV